MDTVDHNRLLMDIDVQTQQMNRKILNPSIPELHLTGLLPVLEMVARARRDYLARVFELAKECDSQDSLPGYGDIEELGELRKTYQELIQGAQALETAIERGYLDVQQ